MEGIFSVISGLSSFSVNQPKPSSFFEYEMERDLGISVISDGSFIVFIPITKKAITSTPTMIAIIITIITIIEIMIDITKIIEMVEVALTEIDL